MLPLLEEHIQPYCQVMETWRGKRYDRWSAKRDRVCGLHLVFAKACVVSQRGQEKRLFVVHKFRLVVFKRRAVRNVQCGTASHPHVRCLFLRHQKLCDGIKVFNYPPVRALSRE